MKKYRIEFVRKGIPEEHYVTYNVMDLIVVFNYIVETWEKWRDVERIEIEQIGGDNDD